MNLHTFLALGGTGRHEAFLPFDFDHTYTTAGRLVFQFHTVKFIVAEGGNMNAYLPCGFKDCGPFFYLDGFVVYCEGYHNFSNGLEQSLITYYFQQF